MLAGLSLKPQISNQMLLKINANIKLCFKKYKMETSVVITLSSTLAKTQYDNKMNKTRISQETQACREEEEIKRWCIQCA